MATAGQTTFTVNYTVGYVDVFLNGVKLTVSDYTASNGTSVVLGVAAALNDIVETLSWTVWSVTNTAIGAGTGTSLALNGATLGANALAATGTASISGNLTAGSVTFGSTTLVATGPTFQQLTVGSGTYTTPAGVKWIKIRMIGGSGGGGSVGSSSGPNGTAGTNSTFGTSLLTANGGGAGIGATGSFGTAVAAASATITAPAVGYVLTGSSSGAPLNYENNSRATVVFTGGVGGVNTMFGAGVMTRGGNSESNGESATTYGQGGNGAGGQNGQNGAASGGGAPGGLEAIISNPSATYAYVVGAKGAGGTGATGAPTYSGGAGFDGLIVVEEHYNY
jgi:hypothetical protein